MWKVGWFLAIKKKREYLRFIDINSLDFSLDLEYRITFKKDMERIHALKSDGLLIKDIKVFSRSEWFDWFGLDLCSNKILNYL